MADAAYLGAALAFFGLAYAYVSACQKLRGGSDD